MKLQEPGTTLFTTELLKGEKGVSSFWFPVSSKPDLGILTKASFVSVSPCLGGENGLSRRREFPIITFFAMLAEI